MKVIADKTEWDKYVELVIPILIAAAVFTALIVKTIPKRG